MPLRAAAATLFLMTLAPAAGMSHTVLLKASREVSQAPVPKALREARRAYLLNESGDVRRFDYLAAELRKWNRFSLVDDAAAADVTINLTTGPDRRNMVVPIAGLFLTTSERTFFLIIRNARNDEAVWTDREAEGLTVKGTINRLLKRLRARLVP